MKKKCCFCGEEVNMNSPHIYGCAKKKGLNLTKDEIKFKQVSFEFPKSSSKEFLIEEYVDNEKSLVDLKDIYGLPYKTTRFLLNYHNIKSRNSSESASTKKTRSQYKKTCIDKYGVENVSKDESIKKKKSDTFMKNYGVDNIWKDPKYYQWLHEHMENKYGQKSVPNLHGNANSWGWDGMSEEDKKNRLDVIHNFQQVWYSRLTDEQKSDFHRRQHENRTNILSSKLESRVQDILSEAGISHVWQKWVGGKSYDFRIEKTNIIIEVQGDYWHANPNKYQADDILNHGNGKLISAKELWEKDENKNKLAKKYGYEVLYLWESDIKVLSDIELLKMILDFIENENNKNKENKKS